MSIRTKQSSAGETESKIDVEIEGKNGEEGKKNRDMKVKTDRRQRDSSWLN